MDVVRFGVIGMGNIGRFHARCLLDGGVRRGVLRAVCRRSGVAGLREEYENKGVLVFGDGLELIGSGEVDAVVVATPHYSHVPLGLAALGGGVHLMVEKPIAAHKADGERLVRKGQECGGVVFGGMFQFRVESRYVRLRRLVVGGELGELVRVNWIATDWYRTEAYYGSGGWRATWGGEGGGVLLNQCLHQLDVLQWLCGMPVRVRGFVQLGRFHEIEVEDSVTAYFEYGNGATGVFVASSGEAPGSSRLEVVGTRGRVVLEGDRLRFTRNEECMVAFGRGARSGFARPEVWEVEVPFEDVRAPHAVVLENFVDAILDGGDLIAPGAEGLGSVELANAMLFSGLEGRVVELPLDGKVFEGRLRGLVEGSKFVKRVVPSSGGGDSDFAQSFRR